MRLNPQDRRLVNDAVRCGGQVAHDVGRIALGNPLGHQALTYAGLKDIRAEQVLSHEVGELVRQVQGERLGASAQRLHAEHRDVHAVDRHGVDGSGRTAQHEV